MPIAIASQFTQRYCRWTQWKVIKAAKNLIYQYDDDGIIYTIYGYDGPEAHVCQIFKGSLPYNIINNGYSQSQNDSDLSDFETNYLSGANGTLNISYLTGNTDGTKIGNNGDRLKTEAQITSISSGIIPTVSNNLRYDDMNVANGGIARNADISTSYSTIYNRNGSGLLFGFTISFEGNLLGADSFTVKLTIDSVVVFEVITVDFANGLYTINNDSDFNFLGLSVVEDKTLRFQVPKNLALTYASNITIQAKKTSGSNKQIKAGLVSLTKVT